MPPVDPTADEPVSREAQLQNGWELYKKKSSMPGLLNYEDFCAGFNAASGGLEQFMRMKSRMTELESRVAHYERMLASWPVPNQPTAMPVSYGSGANLPARLQGAPLHEVTAWLHQATRTYIPHADTHDSPPTSAPA